MCIVLIITFVSYIRVIGFRKGVFKLVLSFVFCFFYIFLEDTSAVRIDGRFDLVLVGIRGRVWEVL